MTRAEALLLGQQRADSLGEPVGIYEHVGDYGRPEGDIPGRHDYKVVQFSRPDPASEWALIASADPAPKAGGLPFDTPEEAPAFDGETYEPAQDHERLGAQALRVWAVVRDGEWRTLAEIEAVCGDPQASISARLRDFRKKKFGENDVPRRHRGDAVRGLYEYRVIPNPAGRLALMKDGGEA